MSKMMVAVVCNSFNEVGGFRLVDLNTRKVQNINKSDINSMVKDVLNLKIDNGRVIDKESKLLRYPLLSSNWRVRENKSNITLWFNSTENKLYGINYKGEFTELTGYQSSEGKLNVAELLKYKPAGVKSARKAINNKNVDSLGQSKIIINSIKDTNKLASAELAVTYNSGTSALVDERMPKLRVINTNSVVAMDWCNEYKLADKLSSENKVSLSQLKFDDISELIKCEVYFAILPNSFLNSRINKSLSEIDRFKLSDGLYLVSYSSSKNFKTYSNIIKGSVYNNIYALFNSDGELKYVFTSYKSIGDVLYEVLSIFDSFELSTYKKINALYNMIHVDKPRFDINFVGACINKNTGKYVLTAEITELDRHYFLELCDIIDYHKYIDWCDKYDTDDTGMTYRILIDTIESGVKHIGFDRSILALELNS